MCTSQACLCNQRRIVSEGFVVVLQFASEAAWAHLCCVAQPLPYNVAATFCLQNFYVVAHLIHITHRYGHQSIIAIKSYTNRKTSFRAARLLTTSVNLKFSPFTSALCASLLLSCVSTSLPPSPPQAHTASGRLARQLDVLLKTSRQPPKSVIDWSPVQAARRSFKTQALSKT